MNARDINSARYQRDRDLNAWSLNWVLDANMLLCASCGAAQCARDADIPFLHLDGCTMSSDLDKHPWIALRDVLANLSRMPG
jgi:hypothetical protein